MSYIIKANFIDQFKIGDNINFNLKILKILYTQYEQLKELFEDADFGEEAGKIIAERKRTNQFLK